jgi:transposase-like protein
MLLLRNSLRAAAEQMMREEVEELCGQSHRPEADAQYRRAGSENGTCHAGGRREAILRPRVRKQVGDGTEREHVLVSYSMMSKPANNAPAVVTALGAGMSTRSQAWASEGVMSKTAASRHWIEATAARIGQLRERDLTKTAFFGLMLDGVVVGNGAVVVIALGLTCTGEKVPLDFEVGSSENAVVCTALTARLQRRGFAPAPGCRLLAILDGAAALQSAVLGIWPHTLIQRCLVHKERNLYGYLRKGDHGEASRLWQRLRLAQGEAAGREALEQLRIFLLPLNAAAGASLAEAGEDLITLHKLNVPATLNLTLLSTNAIENVMRNYRAQTARVSRWRLETNQISRWTASALLHVERGFHRIKGHADLPALLKNLALPSLTPEVEGLRPSTPPRALLLLSNHPIPETNHSAAIHPPLLTTPGTSPAARQY